MQFTFVSTRLTNVTLVMLDCIQMASFCPEMECRVFSIYVFEGSNDCKNSCHTSRNRCPGKLKNRVPLECGSTAQTADETASIRMSNPHFFSLIEEEIPTEWKQYGFTFECPAPLANAELRIEPGLQFADGTVPEEPPSAARTRRYSSTDPGEKYWFMSCICSSIGGIRCVRVAKFLKFQNIQIACIRYLLVIKF